MKTRSEALEKPNLAVDVVLLSTPRQHLEVLLHEREEEPFRGALALPGVAVRTDETLLQAVARALEDKAGMTAKPRGAIHLEQLSTFDGLFRDPRGRTVSVVHLGLMREPPPLRAGSRAMWREVRGLISGALPFDHSAMLELALERLRGKVRYTNIASFLLPEVFRIEELQRVYEAILARSLNRANFRTKLLKIELLERIGVDPEAVGRRGGRPPHRYRFRNDVLEAIARDFL